MFNKYVLEKNEWMNEATWEHEYGVKNWVNK